MRFLHFLIKHLKKNPILTIILVVGFLFRIISTTPGYYYPIGDELLPSEAINMITKHTLALSPQYLGFPPLVPWIMLVVFALFFIPMTTLLTLLNHWRDFYLPIFIVPIFLGVILIRNLFHLNIKKTFLISFSLLWIILIVGGILGLSNYPILQREVLGRDWIKALYWGRYLTAFVGTLVIWATYKLAELCVNKRAALFSALFVSINYRLILSSHVGLPDTYNVFFLLIALLAIGYLLKKRSFKNYLIAFFSMATFFMIKYQSHPILPFLIVHITVSIKESKNSFSKFLKKFFRKDIIVSGTLALVFVLLAHVYHFQNFAKTSEINNYEAIKYGFGRNILDLYPISYFYYIGIGPQLSILSILGILVGLVVKKTRIFTVILISCLPTFAFLYLYYTNGGFFTRNLISTIPIFLIFAALFTDQFYILALRLTPKLKLVHLSILIIFLAFLLKVNIINSMTTAIAYSKEAPRVTAQNWIDQNVRSGNFAGFLGYPRPMSQNIQSTNLLPYYKAFSYQEYLEEKYDYVSIEMSNLRDQWVWWTRQLPQTQIKFWVKPDNLLSQNYYSLAFREMLWTQGQAVFVSPWQAPSHNVAIMRINDKRPDYKQVSLLNKYTNFDNWAFLYYLPEYKDYLKNLEDGNINMLFISGARHLPGSMRIQSEPIKIKPGYGYKIVAKIRNDNSLPKEERDGFIRLDFYKDTPQTDILSRADTSFVSQRVYGGSQWHEVITTGIAPENSNFAVIGFQSDGISQSSFYLKDLEIFQTKNVIEDSGKHFTIDDTQLFLPNNEGIL